MISIDSYNRSNLMCISKRSRDKRCLKKRFPGRRCSEDFECLNSLCLETQNVPEKRRNLFR